MLALPRGGVPVGLEVARALDAPLDVSVVRELGVPHRNELAMGAITSGGARVRNEELILGLGIDAAAFDTAVARESAELRRREQAYRGDRPPLDLSGRTAVLVDDGIATGATTRVALQAVRRRRPAGVVVAVPVAPATVVTALRADADDVVCAVTPHDFRAVGQVYADFRQVDDDEVRAALAAAPGGG